MSNLTFLPIFGIIIVVEGDIKYAQTYINQCVSLMHFNIYTSNYQKKKTFKLSLFLFSLNRFYL